MSTDSESVNDFFPSQKRSSEESSANPKTKTKQQSTTKQWKPSQFDIVLLKDQLLGEAKGTEGTEGTEDGKRNKDAEGTRDIEGILKKIKDRSSTTLAIGPETFKSGLSQVLLFACFNGCLEVVRYFLDHYSKHFDVNACIKYVRETQESMEKRIARLSIVSRVYCPDLVLSEKQQLHSTTLLHGAVMNNRLEIVETLLSAGASVDNVDCCSDTPLLKAVETQPGEASLVSLLIKQP